MKSVRLVGLLAAASLLAAATAQAQTTVGVAGPMTGQYASFGEQLRNGASLALEDINAAGGVLKQQLKLVVGDDACDPKQARSTADRLVGQKVPVVFGHFCSSSSIPASEAYAEGNVLQITPASTNPTFTERKLWNVFRTCGRDDQQGALAGKYLADNFKGKKIAILDDKSTYGAGLANETKKALNALGVKEALRESYTQGDKDFTALVSRMKAADIDIVFVGGYHTESGLILRQMRDQGMKTLLMAGDALADKQFAAITGQHAGGVLMTFGSDPRNRPAAAEVVKKFKAKGIDPEGYTLYTYAAMQIWAAAVEKTGSTDPKKVAATIRAGKWNTVLGEISYDAKGDITVMDYVMYEWKADGTYAELKK
ncbi:MAG: branched-chain amino acid ABC transporter substrate-binding protein [Rhizobiales bacterium]|jgi:branched-chain amino acid transport system substrate-binding protein|nr:branched-chain amino acid ABC transporter substrate-binding protein [Hyphomicrobiales bacterium]